jgi:hypothetical protein
MPSRPFRHENLSCNDRRNFIEQGAAQKRRRIMRNTQRQENVTGGCIAHIKDGHEPALLRRTTKGCEYLFYSSGVVMMHRHRM